ncbi:hypothetical protein GCM10011492_33600 [Flexivirga endophytica]|uniref:DUF2867 domain-containing protein n=1 Tax=Flexivirga endophytica TaxID=1849103 RepID=A0A916TCH1_9MICO|nr:DUF2867 domain-containing protein [Flexivirga endophytica]GGB40053.1 hypothetical protein GCM10011492_33600 [Flexivirga endophytica]GHB47946.1 hypothetical protein GCM10008112_15990 [Flexivirga endophytica]
MTTPRARRLHPIPASEPRGRLLRRGEFLERPWRIHEIAGDFEVFDVWQLPTPGGPDDLPLLADMFAGGTGDHGAPPLVRLVCSVRWNLGRLLRWDDPQKGVGIRVPSLNARLPDDMADAPIGPDFTRLPFTSVYLLRHEFAAELANATCHGVLHLGWVKTESGCWTAQMTVLVKPNGTLGRVYLAGIQPFRRTLVYPAMLRMIERDWRDVPLDGAVRTPTSA